MHIYNDQTFAYVHSTSHSVVWHMTVCLVQMKCYRDRCPSGKHFMPLFVSDFHQQMIEITEILASDWLRANLSVKITDKMLHETLPWD